MNEWMKKSEMEMKLMYRDPSVKRMTSITRQETCHMDTVKKFLWLTLSNIHSLLTLVWSPATQTTSSYFNTNN